MGDIVDIRQYLSSIPADHELEVALMKSLDALPIALSDSEKHEIYVYALGLWSDVKQMEADSLKTFTLEIPCTEEQKEKVNSQINECISYLINPRTKLINNLVAELIVCKIKEIQMRQSLAE